MNVIARNFQIAGNLILAGTLFVATASQHKALNSYKPYASRDEIKPENITEEYIKEQRAAHRQMLRVIAAGQDGDKSITLSGGKKYLLEQFSMTWPDQGRCHFIALVESQRVTGMNAKGNPIYAGRADYGYSYPEGCPQNASGPFVR